MRQRATGTTQTAGPAPPSFCSTAPRAVGSRPWLRFWLDHPWVEPLVFVVLALGFEWIVDPVASHGVEAAYLTVVVLIPLASNVLHRDGPRTLGFRFDNVLRSGREVLPVSLIALAVIVGLSLGSGHGLDLGARFRESLWNYPLWGLAQQWALQGFVHRRLCDAWHRRRLAAVASSLLFGALHFPNPVLLVFTVVGGLAWCLLYQRHQNLFTLALSHGWLAAVALVSLPPAWVHGLRVGPEYWG